MPRPILRSAREDRDPLRYRVHHEVSLWKAGERSRMRQTVVERRPALAV
jgi:alkaline phosphatase D